MKKKTKRVDKQFKLDSEFEEIARALLALYHSKNIKYDDSFNNVHKTYREANYNIKRKFDRLEVLSKKKALNNDDLTGLVRELGDMAVYSIMSIMKFAPKHVQKNYREFFMSDV